MRSCSASSSWIKEEEKDNAAACKGAGELQNCNEPSSLKPGGFGGDRRRAPARAKFPLLAGVSKFVAVAMVRQQPARGEPRQHDDRESLPTALRLRECERHQLPDVRLVQHHSPHADTTHLSQRERRWAAHSRWRRRQHATRLQTYPRRDRHSDPRQRAALPVVRTRCAVSWSPRPKSVVIVRWRTRVSAPHFPRQRAGGATDKQSGDCRTHEDRGQPQETGECRQAWHEAHPLRPRGGVGLCRTCGAAVDDPTLCCEDH